MVGLLLLKQLENISDENIVLQFKRNPYYQYFCGFTDYTPSLPCHSTELVKFRNRIGKDGFEFIFKMSVELHKDNAKETQVIIDSAVQESNMTFPTDGKLAIKIVGDKIVNEAICDRGYRGVKEVTVNDNEITISIPDTKRKKDTKKQINIKREKFKKRAAIEPIIGHLKSDHRMARNYLKGFKGDEINLLLAATAFNLKKWMNIYFYALFIQDFNLVLESIQEMQRLKSLHLLLLILKLRFII